MARVRVSGSGQGIRNWNYNYTPNASEHIYLFSIFYFKTAFSRRRSESATVADQRPKSVKCPENNLRFFIQHHEAQQVSEVWRPEGFPPDHYFIAQGSDLGKLQHMVLTWGRQEKILGKNQSTAGKRSGWSRRDHFLMFLNPIWHETQNKCALVLSR